jgi:hypothetical protein
MANLTRLSIPLRAALRLYVCRHAWFGEIAAQLRGGSSWSEIQRAMGVSRATIAKVARRSAAMAAE